MKVIRILLLYDGRETVIPGYSTILDTASNLGEANRAAKEYGDVICYSYDIGPRNVLLNQTFEFHKINGIGGVTHESN